MKKGFTLIELLAVVVVIAILATIGAYSVNRILDSTKKSVLNKSAITIRKTANLHISANRKKLVDNYAELDLTPGNNLESSDPDYVPRGDDADLLELGKDPWDRDYKLVKAFILRENKIFRITVFIITGDDRNWILTDNSNELIEFNLLIAEQTEQLKTGLSFNIAAEAGSLEYHPQAVTKVTLIKSDNEPLASNLYSFQSLTTPNGDDLAGITINRAGSYHVTLTFDKVINYTIPTPFIVTNSTEVYDVVLPSYPVTNNTTNIIFKLRSNLSITSASLSGGTTLNNPNKNVNLTTSKTYTTEGTKSETLTIIDSGGNTITHNLNNFNVNCGRVKTLDCVGYIRLEQNNCSWGDRKDGGNICWYSGMRAFNTSNVNILNMNTMPVELNIGGSNITNQTILNTLKTAITNYTFGPNGGEPNYAGYYEINLGDNFNLNRIDFLSGLIDPAWCSVGGTNLGSFHKLIIYDKNRQNPSIVFDEAFGGSGCDVSTKTINST